MATRSRRATIGTSVHNAFVNSKNIADALEDPESSDLAFVNGSISRNDALAVRELLHSRLHTKPWTLIFQSSYPEDGDAFSILQEALSTSVESFVFYEMAWHGVENDLRTLECVSGCSPVEGKIGSIKFISSALDQRFVPVLRNLAMVTHVQAYQFSGPFEFLPSGVGVADDGGVASLLARVYDGIEPKPNGLFCGIYDDDMCGDLGLLESWGDALEHASFCFYPPANGSVRGLSALTHLRTLRLKSPTSSAYESLSKILSHDDCKLAFLRVESDELNDDNARRLFGALKRNNSVEVLTLELMRLGQASPDLLLDFLRENNSIVFVQFGPGISSNNPNLVVTLENFLISDISNYRAIISFANNSDANSRLTPLSFRNMSGCGLMRKYDTIPIGLWPYVFGRVKTVNIMLKEDGKPRAQVGDKSLDFLRLDSMYHFVTGCASLFSVSSNEI